MGAASPAQCGCISGRNSQIFGDAPVAKHQIGVNKSVEEGLRYRMLSHPAPSSKADPDDTGCLFRLHMFILLIDCG